MAVEFHGAPCVGDKMTSTETSKAIRELLAMVHEWQLTPRHASQFDAAVRCVFSQHTDEEIESITAPDIGRLFQPGEVQLMRAEFDSHSG